MSERRPGHLDLTLVIRLQRPDRRFEIAGKKCRVRADRRECGRDHPFRLPPQGRGECRLVWPPARLIFVPVAHQFIDIASVKTARLRRGLSDEVPEQDGIGQGGRGRRSRRATCSFRRRGGPSGQTPSAVRTRGVSGGKMRHLVGMRLAEGWAGRDAGRHRPWLRGGRRRIGSSGRAAHRPSIGRPR